MPYTLTMLGTDTRFSIPSETPPTGYDKAETLSFASTLIKTTTGTPAKADGVVQYKAQEIAVVDGPTTLGTEVGDRIARGVLAILEALHRDETEINIIAHSRGAVESILIAHELERIKNLESLTKDAITKSVCPYTKTAMSAIYSSGLKDLDLAKIQANVAHIKLNILAVDPVPGGNWYGVTHASYLAWRDPRFYTLPAIVQVYEQYIYENERTRCFKPIVPKAMSSETRFSLHRLPGHHGTGSGNCLSQQRKAEEDSSKTGDVQALLLLKTIDFLRSHGVQFQVESIHRSLFLAVTNLLDVSDERAYQKEKEALLLHLYKRITENKTSYEAFNKTSYAYLGQEQAWAKSYVNPLTVTDDRIVHYQGHNDTYLKSFLPPVFEGKFLNLEHARLHLYHEMNLDDQTTLVSIFPQIIGKLLTPPPTQAPQGWFTWLTTTKTKTTPEPAEIGLLKLSIQICVVEMAQLYLNKGIDPSQKEDFYMAVQDSFKQVKKVDTTAAKELDKFLSEQLNETVKIKFRGLDEQYKRMVETLSQKPDERAKSLLKTCLQELNSLPEREDGRFQSILKLLQSNAGLGEIQNQLLVQQKELKQELDKLEIAQQTPSPLKTTSLLMLYVFTSETIEKMGTALDNKGISKNNLQKVIDYCTEIDAFQETMTRLQDLVDPIQSLDLEARKTHLIHLLEQSLKVYPLEPDEIQNLLRSISPALAGKITNGLKLPIEEEKAQLIYRLIESQNEKETATKEKEALALLLEEKQAAINTLQEANQMLETPYQQRIDSLALLTEDYLLHLSEAVRQSYQNMPTEWEGILKYRFGEGVKNDDPLKEKFEIVQGLYQTLTEKALAPSQRLKAFKEQLEKADTVISKHRDPLWRQFVKDALAILAILITGIVPGMIYLAIKKPWQSQGARFFKEAISTTETPSPVATPMPTAPSRHCAAP